MLDVSKALSSLSVNDIQKTREFYGSTLGLELSCGPEGTLVVPFPATAPFPDGVLRHQARHA